MYMFIQLFNANLVVHNILGCKMYLEVVEYPALSDIENCLYSNTSAKTNSAKQCSSPRKLTVHKCSSQDIHYYKQRGLGQVCLTHLELISLKQWSPNSHVCTTHHILYVHALACVCVWLCTVTSESI